MPEIVAANPATALRTSAVGKGVSAGAPPPFGVSGFLALLEATGIGNSPSQEGGSATANAPGQALAGGKVAALIADHKVQTDAGPSAGAASEAEPDGDASITETLEGAPDEAPPDAPEVVNDFGPVLPAADRVVGEEAEAEEQVTEVVTEMGAEAPEAPVAPEAGDATEIAAAAPGFILAPQLNPIPSGGMNISRTPVPVQGPAGARPNGGANAPAAGAHQDAEGPPLPGRQEDAASRSGAPVQADPGKGAAQATKPGQRDGSPQSAGAKSEAGAQPLLPPPAPAVSNLVTGQPFGEDALGQLRAAHPVSQAPVQAGASMAGVARPDLTALAFQIAGKAGSGLQRFEIRLDPPELGRIEVRLDFARDGRMTTQLMVDRPETLDLLMRDARGLEKALQSTGLKLEDGAVQYQLRDQSGSAGQSRDEGGGATRKSGEALDPSDEQGAPGEHLEAYTRRAVPGGLDIRI